jgi:hypothetical protein
MRILAAIVWLMAADLALAIYTRSPGATDKTFLFRCLNSAVARADANPHLPARFRDPRDVADSLRSI